MLKYLLALLLTFMTVSGPASALCTEADPVTESCCCTVADVDCVQLSGSCCGETESQPSAPAQQRNDNWSSVPAVVAIVSLPSVASSAQELQPVATTTSKPLHLASNKIYLRNRSLLI
jgi:hypothetical protein